MRFTRADYAASLGMIAYASSVVATPIVLVEISRELSFGLSQGGGIEAVRTGFLLAILIASGAASARVAKSTLLALGNFALAAGLLAYALAPAYGFVLVAIVLVGLGGGVQEALLNPVIQDAHPKDSGRYLNVVNAFFSVGVLVSVVIVGDLLTRGVSWRVLIGAIGAVTLVAAFAFALVRREELRGERGAATAEGAPVDGVTAAAVAVPVWHHARAILREPLFWLFGVAMFCGGGAEGAFTFWSASYVQLNFDAVARAGGFGTAAFAAGMVVGRLASGRFVRQERLQRLIIVSAIVGVVASLTAWAVSTIAGFFFVVFVAGLSIACFWPSIQSHAAARIPLDSTMLFVLLSVGGIPGFGLTSWFMGVVAEAYGLRTSLLVIPALLALLATVMIVSSRVGTDRR